MWVREHNRICDVIQEHPKLSKRSGNRQFKIAKAVVVAKMQQITVNGFLPALGITQAELEASQTAGGRKRFVNRRGNPRGDVSAEFSIAYRLGHTLIPDKIGKFSLGDLFRGGVFFLEDDNTPSPHPSGKKYRDDSDDDIDDMMRALANEKSAELDGKMSNGLRNILFGPFMPETMMGAEDLCLRNIYRGRDLHLPSYAGLARCYGITPNQRVRSVALLLLFVMLGFHVGTEYWYCSTANIALLPGWW